MNAGLPVHPFKETPYASTKPVPRVKHVPKTYLIPQYYAAILSPSYPHDRKGQKKTPIKGVHMRSAL